jgi:hypothetical protein
MGYAILYTNWLICEVVWLAWLQLPVVFKYRLVTALVPLASDSRILSPRYGAAITLAETYAACVEQPVHRLTWAISAAMNLICKGYDVGNAFAEAPAPTSPFFMKPDAQFRQWWEERLGKDPIPEGYVIPVRKALQGHPESPQLWDKYISKMIICLSRIRETNRSSQISDLVELVKDIFELKMIWCPDQF